MGVHALGLHLDPAGRKAHGEERRRDGRGRVRLQRRAVLRRQHRADRRLPRQRRRGAAWVFTRSGATWTQQGEKLTGSGESGAGEFGSSVALSPTATRRWSAATATTRQRGAAWVFTRSGRQLDPAGRKAHRQRRERRGQVRHERGAVLRRQHRADRRLDRQQRRRRGVGVHALGLHLDPAGRKLTGSGETGAGEFGTAWRCPPTATRADRRARDNGGAAPPGCSHARATNGPSRAKSSPAGETGAGEFGTSVALSAEGNTALVGGPVDDSGVGAAWVFARSGAKWTQQGEKLTAKRGRDRRRQIRLRRGAVLRRRHRADRRAQRQRRRRCRVGVHEHRPRRSKRKPASPIAQTTATLNATVNPNGAEVNKCEFEYGTTISYGKTRLLRLPRRGRARARWRCRPR